MSSHTPGSSAWTPQPGLPPQPSPHDPYFAPHVERIYEVLGPVAEGGMGAIFKVRDRRLGRLAALKLLHHRDPASQQRFLREAEITASLDHPHIPPVYEVGRSTNGELFILMRLIEGRTLSEELKALEPGDDEERRRLLRILIKVGEAVAYADAQGIVHRDIKPSNIMVGRFGEVLLMDWGIARRADAGSREDALLRSQAPSPSEVMEAGRTVAGALVGTPGYMAPEQANGEPIDGRADVYALGLLLGELLLGEPLVRGESSLVRVSANADGRTQPLPRSLPAELRWITAQALERDPELRTASAVDLCEQLEAWLEGTPVPGYPYGRGELAMRGARARPALMTGLLLGSLALSLLLLAGQALDRAQRQEAEVARAQEGEREALAEVDRAERQLALIEEARALASRGAPWPAARERLEQAIALAERSEASLLAAARIARLANEPEAAQAWLNDCAETHPPAYDALYALHELQLSERSSQVYREGVVLTLTGPLRELLARARARGESNEYTLLLDALRARRDDPNEALRLVREALATAPTLAPAARLLGELARQTRDHTGVPEALEKAVQANPEDLDLRRERMVYGNATARFEVAVDESRAVLERRPSDRLAFINGSSALLCLERYEAAAALLERALAAHPEEVYLLNNRGYLRQVRGELDAAIADYDRALALNPRYADPLVERGIIRLDRGEREAARDDLERFLQLCGPTHRDRQRALSALQRLAREGQ